MIWVRDWINRYMVKSRIRFSVPARAFVLLLMIVLGISCSNNRLRKANVDEVTEGMSKKQVESILGPPSDVDNTDFVLSKKMTYVYRQDNGTVTIVFKDDKVTDKYSTLPR